MKLLFEVMIFFQDNHLTSEITRNESLCAFFCGERSCSVVECLTGDRGAAGSRLTGVTALCP